MVIVHTRAQISGLRFLFHILHLCLGGSGIFSARETVDVMICTSTGAHLVLGLKFNTSISSNF